MTTYNEKPMRPMILCLAMISASATGEETVVMEEPVKVIASADPSIFPDRWRSKRINANATPLPPGEIDRSRRVLKRAMSKYPVEVLASNLRCVYIVNRLVYFGISTGGTNSRTAVYLANRGKQSGFTDDWLEATFHAEFSSILFREHAQYLDENRWRAINDDNFQYLGSGVAAIQKGVARENSETQLHEAGFLSQYGMSTLENDFNAFAKQLLSGRHAVWTIAEKHPRVAEKVQLTLSFYKRLDPSLNEAYFLSLVE